MLGRIRNESLNVFSGFSRMSDSKDMLTDSEDVFSTKSRDL
jgi:hypothetical protein